MSNITKTSVRNDRGQNLCVAPIDLDRLRVFSESGVHGILAETEDGFDVTVNKFDFDAGTYIGKFDSFLESLMAIRYAVWPSL